MKQRANIVELVYMNKVILISKADYEKYDYIYTASNGIVYLSKHKPLIGKYGVPADLGNSVVIGSIDLHNNLFKVSSILLSVLNFYQTSLSIKHLTDVASAVISLDFSKYEEIYKDVKERNNVFHTH